MAGEARWPSFCKKQFFLFIAFVWAKLEARSQSQGTDVLMVDLRKLDLSQSVVLRVSVKAHPGLSLFYFIIYAPPPLSGLRLSLGLTRPSLLALCLLLLLFVSSCTAQTHLAGEVSNGISPSPFPRRRRRGRRKPFPVVHERRQKFSQPRRTG